MIEVKQLVFDYLGTRALNNVTFHIQRGSIAALVGPNGAGKTTLLSCIAGLQLPFSGQITLDGIDVLEYPRKIHKKIGYLADFFGLYQNLTVYQSLLFACRSRGVAAHNETAALEYVAERLQLTNRLKDKVANLSRGLRQRVAIAQAIVHEPLVLLLDEPAAGLDPEARHELSKLFIDLQQKGMTLIVSSHILAELEEYCTEMLILRQGRLISITHHDQTKPTIKIRLRLCREQPDAQQLISTVPMVSAVTHEDDDSYLLECEAAPLTQYNILQAIMQKELTVYSFAEERNKMQNIYIQNIEQQVG